MRVLQGFAECCEGRNGRSGPAEGQPAEHQGALKERAEGRAGASEGINCQSHIKFCSDPDRLPAGGGLRVYFLNFYLSWSTLTDG